MPSLLGTSLVLQIAQSYLFITPTRFLPAIGGVAPVLQAQSLAVQKLLTTFGKLSWPAISLKVYPAINGRASHPHVAKQSN
jgi:hypothetical protein